MDIITVIKSLKPGSFVRIGYKTEPPMKAEYRNQGYKVIKTTTMTTRFGIDYHNIHSVKIREQENKNETFSQWKD